jgi:hypothetical protein
MAASLALLSASPFCLRYEYTHDGAGSGQVFRTQAQMVADCASMGAPSPLEDLLSKTYSNVAWGALKSNPKASIYSCNEAIAAGSAVAAAWGLQGGVTNALQVTGVNANGGTAIIEVRFNHTIDR